MKVTEIRVGNLIESNNEHCKVEAILLNGAIRTDGGDGKLFEFKPIPLTEQLIIKFGFDKVEDLGDMISYEFKDKKRGYGIKYDHEEWVFYLYAGTSYTPLICDAEPFQYVHQLQNLYFALTGIELIIIK